MYFILKCCFLCLNYDNNHLISINKKDSNNVSIKETLKICLPEITELEMHETVCSKCYKSLNEMYYFKQKCLETKGRLNNYIKILQQKYFDSTFQNELDLTLIDIKHLGLFRDIHEYNVNQIKENNSDNDLSVSDDKSDDSYYSDSIFNDFQYKCEACNKEFIQKYNYLEHIESHKKIVSTSKQKSNLQTEIYSTVNEQLKPISHIETNSDLNYQQKCYSCDKPLVRKHNLLKHRKNNFSRAKYKCSNCKSKFIGKNHLTKHTNDEVRRNSFMCEFCNKEYANKKDLKRHKLKKHSENVNNELFKCFLCSEKFANNEFLANHMVLQHNKNGMQNESCRSENIVDS